MCSDRQILADARIRHDARLRRIMQHDRFRLVAHLARSRCEAHVSASTRTCPGSGLATERRSMPWDDAIAFEIFDREGEDADPATAVGALRVLRGVRRNSTRASSRSGSTRATAPPSRDGWGAPPPLPQRARSKVPMAAGDLVEEAAAGAHRHEHDPVDDHVRSRRHVPHRACVLQRAAAQYAAIGAAGGDAVLASPFDDSPCLVPPPHVRHRALAARRILRSADGGRRSADPRAMERAR